MLLAQRDWLDERLADGTFVVAHPFAQGGGGIGVVNADSGEELSRILAGSPLFALSTLEVEPLSEPSVLEHFASSLRRAAGVPA